MCAYLFRYNALPNELFTIRWQFNSPSSEQINVTHI